MRLVLFFFLFATLAPLVAQDDTEEFDRILKEIVSARNYNGNVLVAKEGKVIYRGSFGVADPLTGQALNDQTVFRLASLSKQFTALAIALLEDDGKLDFDDPIAKYVPELAHYKGVTIRHLLHHYGGLPNYMSLISRKGNKKAVYNNELAIKLMEKKKPKREFEPGTSSSYSNSGYMVLATIIERASGKTYAEFLKDRIFTPLGMSRSFVGYPNPPQRDNQAAGYEKNKKGEWVRLDNGTDPYGFGILANIYGDGMVFSTLDDLHRYTEGIKTDALLPEAKRKVLTTAGNLEEAPDKGYAFGQQVRQSKHFGQVIEHSGSWAGFVTNMERHPDQGNVIISLSNTESGFREIFQLARELLRGNPLTVPKTLRPVQVKVSDLQPYPGTYKLNDDLLLVITTKGNKLFMEPTGQRNYPMKAYSPTGFFLEGTTIELEFNLSVTGEATSIIFTQSGKVTECPRVE